MNKIVVSDHPSINGIKALRLENGNLIAECTEANAARLALAWNCHDELVEALKLAEAHYLPTPVLIQIRNALNHATGSKL